MRLQPLSLGCSKRTQVDELSALHRPTPDLAEEGVLQIGLLAVLLHEPVLRGVGLVHGAEVPQVLSQEGLPGDVGENLVLEDEITCACLTSSSAPFSECSGFPCQNFVQ